MPAHERELILRHLMEATRVDADQTVNCEAAVAYMHWRRKRGVCRGSDTPTIYVGDIDMYVPR